MFPVFEPFVMASQVKQVYYLPYACKSRADLQDWWVTYQVTPRGYVPLDDNSDDSNPPARPIHEMSFFFKRRDWRAHLSLIWILS